MRLFFFRKPVDRRENEKVYDRKISITNFIVNSKMRDRRKLYVKKTGRLVEIYFPCELKIDGKLTGNLQFSEKEILYLANICRNNRSDEEFLRAIDEACLPEKEKSGKRLAAREDEYDPDDADL